VGGRGRGQKSKVGVGGKGGEMTQTLYAHMNKGNFFKNLTILNLLINEQYIIPFI
jgi:hypothetical protein